MKVKFTLNVQYIFYISIFFPLVASTITMRSHYALIFLTTTFFASSKCSDTTLIWNFLLGQWLHKVHDFWLFLYFATFFALWHSKKIFFLFYNFLLARNNNFSLSSHSYKLMCNGSLDLPKPSRKLINPRLYTTQSMAVAI